MNTDLGLTTFLPQKIFCASSVAANHSSMFELETDETSSKSIGPILSYDPKRVIMSRIFFSFEILLRPPAGEKLACSIPRSIEGNRLYKPLASATKIIENASFRNHQRGYLINFRFSDFFGFMEPPLVPPQRLCCKFASRFGATNRKP